MPCGIVKEEPKGWDFRASAAVVIHLVQSLVFRAAGLSLVGLPHHIGQIGGSRVVWPSYEVPIAGLQRRIVPAASSCSMFERAWKPWLAHPLLATVLHSGLHPYYIVRYMTTLCVQLAALACYAFAHHPCNEAQARWVCCNCAAQMV